MGEASLGIARLVEVVDKNAPNGSVISSSDKGPTLSTRPYDPQVLGIVARDAAIILNSGKSASNGIPVIATGQVYLRVSTKTGKIKKGDLLTTSTIPGVAIKADKDGYVLGNALEDYSESNPATVGTIAVDLNLHYFNSKPTMLGTLSDILKIAVLPTKDSPTPLFKYIVAAIVVITSFILTFMTFGRTAAKGVEALGRNPAASGLIHLGIFFNITISVVIALVGLVVAFLILRL
jgi:F0F1-type ATP synthase membrane subunit c/vacuolar-type H+-ATPase subunit K